MFDENLNRGRQHFTLNKEEEELVLWNLELLFPQFIGDHNQILEQWVWKNKALQVYLALSKVLAEIYSLFADFVKESHFGRAFLVARLTTLELSFSSFISWCKEINCPINNKRVD